MYLIVFKSIIRLIYTFFDFMRIIKKTIGYIIAIALWVCVFNPTNTINEIYAQTTPATQDDGSQKANIEEAWKDAWDFLDLVLKLVYVVVWPMIFLAGIAMDNTMVYGSVFHMDAPLWDFWNMTKNFANFGLAFIVLFAILKWVISSFSKSKADERSPINIITKTLIAWVLIQASWFLMSVIIDISTIATYAIWGMPMSLMNDTSWKLAANDQRIIQTHSHLELNNIDKISDETSMIRYKIPYTWWVLEISPCLLKDIGPNTYIVGRLLGDERFNYIGKTLPPELDISHSDLPTRNICIFWGRKIVFFNEFPWVATNTWGNYSSTLNTTIEKLGDHTKELEICNFIINLDRTNLTGNCWTELQALQNKLKEWLEPDQQREKYGSTIYENLLTKLEKLPNSDNKAVYWVLTGDSRIKKTTAPTVAKIIKEAQWFAGPLATIFVSIMDFASLSDTSLQNSSIGKNLGELIIKSGVALAMIFPLIALAVILFIRIWYLRVAIAASPIFILLEVFKKTLWKTLWDSLKTFSLENIIKAVFAPVITVFALSISIIFMSTLNKALSEENINQVKIFEEFWITEEEKDDYKYMTIFWYTVAYPKRVHTFVWATGDRFSWMIINFCGIGIMRFILFAAIKASWAIGKVWESIKSFGENVFKTAPILPIAWWVWFWTIGDLIKENKVEEYRKNRIAKVPEQEKRRDEYLETKFSGLKNNFGADTDFNNYEKPIINNAIQTGNSNKVFEELTNRWFLKKWLNPEEQKQELQEFFSNNKDFREMIYNNNPKEDFIKDLFGQKDFVSKEKIKEIKNTIAGKFNTMYNNTDELNAEIVKVTEEELKELPVNDLIKDDINIGNAKYKIIIKEDPISKKKELSVETK